MNKKFWVALGLIAAAAIGLGVVVKLKNVEASGGYPRVPLVPLAAQPDGEDVKFAKGMIPINEEAIEVAQLADTRANNPSVRQLAADMNQLRTGELTEMRGWMSRWEASAGTPPAVARTISDQETALKASTGADFDQRFLTVMIEHHQRALELAQREKTAGRYAPAREFAIQLIGAYQSELSQMQKLVN